MDRRTKRQKLEAMANQDVSPHEAEVARLKLEAMGPGEKETVGQQSFIYINGQPVGWAGTGSWTVTFTWNMGDNPFNAGAYWYPRASGM